MQVHDLEAEAGDPQHQPAQGRLIGQLGAQGCRVRADGDRAVVEFRAHRGAGPARERDLVRLWSHQGCASRVRWFTGAASVPGSWARVLTLRRVIRDRLSVASGTLVPSRKTQAWLTWAFLTR